MGRSKKKRSRTLEEVHPDWVVSEEIQINGRNVAKGTELSIVEERGRFIFVKHVQTPTAEWIDVIGGPKGVRVFRSFRSDRVKRVHWKNKLRESFKNSEKLESS
jgi:hypothetical protein